MAPKETRMSALFKAHLALAAVALIYGANYLIAKTVMPNPIGPNSFILLRVLGACICFWFIAARKIQIPKKEDLGRFILCGLTGVAINQLLFFNGLSLTSPINSSIIMTSNPIMVMLISALIYKQAITTKKAVGLALGAIGAISLLLLSTGDHSKLSNPLGDLCILINSMSYAFYLVLVKPLMKKYSPLTVVTWVFSVGLIAVSPFGGLGITDIAWSSLDVYQWLAVGYVILFVTFLTYLLNILALQHTTATTASAYIYFQPLLAIFFSYLFTQLTGTDYVSDFTLMKMACGVCIIVGVYMVSERQTLEKTL